MVVSVVSERSVVTKVFPVPLARRSRNLIMSFVLVTFAALTCAGATALFGDGVLYALVLIGVATAAGAAMWVAVHRFEVFVLALLLIRPSLDRLPSIGPLDPSSMLALLFIVTASAWLAGRVHRGYRPSAVTMAFGALGATAVISCLASPVPVLSAVAASKTLAGALMLAVLEQMLRERPERARTLVAIVLASAIVPGLTALLQLATVGGTLIDPTIGLSRVVGTFVHPNPFATYLSMLIVLGLAVLPHLSRAMQPALSAFLLLSVVALAGTFSRGGWIATALGVALLIGMRSKLLLLVSVTVGGVAAWSVPAVRDRFADLGAPPPVAGVPANSLQWRLEYWADVLPLAQRNPVTGIGFEAVQNTSPSGLPPHNAFVQAYVELGMLGLAALLAVIVTVALALRQRIRHAEPGLERALALAAAGIALGLLAQTLTENLLSQTMAFWYFAAAGALGLPAQRRAREGARSGAADAPWRLATPAGA